jgi:hypothetical protein
MQSAVQIVAKELDERLEALKHMPQGPEMRRQLGKIQDTIFRLTMVVILGVPMDFLEPQPQEEDDEEGA